MENNMETNIETPVVEAKKPGKVGAVFFGLLMIMIYLVVTSIPQLFVLIPIMGQAAIQSGGDVTAYQAAILDLYAQNADALTISTSIGTMISVIIVVLWYFFGVYKKNVKNGTHVSVLPKLKNGYSIGFIATSTLSAYGLAVLINMLAQKTMPMIGNAFQVSMDAIVGGVDILGFILTLVFAPIGEELLLRGIVFNRAKKSFGLIGWMILSGILFGIFHLNPIQGLYAIPIGMLFGYIAYKYESVIPCIIAHAINNLIASFSGELRISSSWYIPMAMFVVLGVVAVLLGKKVEFLKEEK